MGRITARDGKWEKRSIFRMYIRDEDGTGTYFETDQAKTDTPTLYFNAKKPSLVKSGKVNRIHHRLNPTNAVTYTLRLWWGAYASDYQSNMVMIWESDALRADDTDYDERGFKIPFELIIPGRMYYSIDWTGAPATTTGFIMVTGEVVEA